MAIDHVTVLIDLERVADLIGIGDQYLLFTTRSDLAELDGLKFASRAEAESAIRYRLKHRAPCGQSAHS